MVRATLSLVALAAWAGTARTDDAVLATAAAGHRQTVESIRTIRYRERTEAKDNGKRIAITLAVWQDGDRRRTRYTSDGFTISNEPDKRLKQFDEWVVKNGRGTRVQELYVEGRNPQKQATIQNLESSTSGEYPDLGWSSIGLRLTDRPPVWLKDALTGSVNGQRWTWEARRENMGGHPTIFLEGKVDAGHGLAVCRVWLDPAAGYLPRKMICFGPASKTTEDKPASHYEVARFHPPYKDTGISFPAEATHRYFATDGVGSTTLEEKMTFEDVRINDPIPDGVFDLKIPPNCWVVDRTGGGQYHTGPDGKPLTPPQPIVPVPPPDELPAPSAWGWRHYLLIIGGSALCLLAVALLVRRGRGGPAVPQPATGG